MILITGGTGRLGTALQKIFPYALYPTRKEFDLLNSDQMNDFICSKNYEIDTIIHCAAYTNPVNCEEKHLPTIGVNIIGTANLAELCTIYKIKLVYISTEYVFDGKKGLYEEDDPVRPINRYACSKLAGECTVRILDDDKYLIIRCAFNPNPYGNKMPKDQYNSAEPIDVIAEKVVHLVESEATGIFHIGGERHSMYDFAKQMSPMSNIQECSRKEMEYNVPKDTSLDTRKYIDLINGKEK